MSVNLNEIHALFLSNYKKKPFNDFKVTSKWTMVAELTVEFGKILSYTQADIFENLNKIYAIHFG